MNAVQFPIFLPNKGQVKDVPEEFLLESLSPYSRNMEYCNEYVQSRSGLRKFSETQLSGAILEQFRLIRANGDAYNLFFTPKDIYAYDFSNSRFDILDPVYTTGTIAISGTTVTGTGTSWSANVKAGDYLKVGSGGVHTGSTWYEVASVDSNTQITLTSSAGTVSAGSAYVIRKTFTGDDTDFWCVRKFTDATYGDIFIATNGIDTPVYGTGSGAVSSVSGLPSTMKAKYLEVYKDRVIFVNTVEGGSNQPERVRASDVADVNSYTTILFEDLIDDGSGCTGVKAFGDYLIIAKGQTFYQGRFVGGTGVFDYDRIYGTVGCKSNRSMVVVEDWLYYYGGDKKFHRWNGSTDQIISEENFEETNQFDPNLDQYIVGASFPAKNQIRWFCPYQSQDYNNYIFVFDTKTDTARVWDCGQEQALCSIGNYVLQSDLYLDDPVWGEYYLDEVDGYFDDFSFSSNATTFIYGGYDGYVRICDTGSDDDGVAFTRRLRFKRFNFGAPTMRKRLWKQQWWFRKEASGDVTLTHYYGDMQSAHSALKTISLEDANKDIVKVTVTLDIEAQNFQPEITSENFFALIGFINFVFPKRRAF